MTSDRSSGSASSAVRLPLAVAAAVLAVFAARTIEQRLSVRAVLAEGENAFRRGDFTRAADHFHSALAIEPASTTVRLRLVAAYQNQYVPGGESAANAGVATHALEEIALVLERDPSNRAALLAAGEINEARSDYDQAREWYGRLAAINPSSAAAFARLSAASLAWASGAVLDAEARAGLMPVHLGRRSAQREGGPIANEDLRRSLAARWSATIVEGIDAASKAVTLDPGHEGAMLTLDAWHRLAADLAASPDEYRRHMIAGDEWRHKALDVRRLRAERGSR